MLKNILKDLNFSEKETAVYLTLLELGSAKAGDISKKADITRTTVYDILTSLLKKGLVNKYKKGSQTFFGALDPNRLLTYIDREIEQNTVKLTKQKQEVKELLPELVSLQNKASAKPKVQFYEGKTGMREAYEDTLTAKGGIVAYANVETMHEGLPNFFPTYYKRRSKEKVFIKAILPKNKASIARSTNDQIELRDTRFLPEGETFSPEVNIYNDKVLIASWKEKMALIIESKELADLHRTIFDQLWNKLDR
ncbi:TrmB family transcriptional regulator [Candidatus Uhrbacteria bacterium]|jgi:HTH-type transcriptional regulator, sugar sensing transcriptional regulator|nr:TrmB family transcriptional regulator [Candidatus Uhrbacteria bacterium]